ncbi:hypothetical protein BKA63DRAFT_416040 [Paraphoma chrysanthemicola]|nr:hypothetical protein BKA63DRAFT_416040 [Paraphoma chrysanthemicola]
MAHHHSGSRRHASAENELWFSMPNSSRGQQDHTLASEQSAYRATSHRLSVGATSSTPSRIYSGVPSISTTADTNKPLPPSPTGSHRKSRKSTHLRSFLGRPPSAHLDPNHLQPAPYHHPYSSTNANLSLETNGQYHHAYSRSMPSSPYEHDQREASSRPMPYPRAHSAASDYSNAMLSESHVVPIQETYPVRTSSMHTYFETSPPRARTFPTENSVASPTMREGVSGRPRPHTWLSPTESFSDASQFSLFVQATTGLPEDLDTMSPNGPPQLQGSLFARRAGNDTIPLPAQYNQEPAPRSTRLRTDWQNFEPPPFSHRAVSAPVSHSPRPEPYQRFEGSPHIDAVNRELELLGLEDDNQLDDELPDYQQSQAEAHAKRRAEASARARELEARWRSTRGR